MGGHLHPMVKKIRAEKEGHKVTTQGSGSVPGRSPRNLSASRASVKVRPDGKKHASMLRRARTTASVRKRGA